MWLRLIRNSKIECLYTQDHRASPWAPRYDVEEVDLRGLPLRVLATGVTAVVGLTLIDRHEAD